MIRDKDGSERRVRLEEEGEGEIVVALVSAWAVDPAGNRVWEDGRAKR